jgi:plasmid stabilization system protein ParE
VAGRRFRVHPEADRDLFEGLAFYATRSFIAAERFLDEIEAALELIREAPDRWPFYRLGMRRYVLTSYPYSIVYRARVTEIQVYAVAHAKRRPLYWRRRRF